jgi:hypothetical protein
LLSNRAHVAAKSAVPKEAAGGAVQRGPALLSGVLRCGRCGRTRNVA